MKIFVSSPVKNLEEQRALIRKALDEMGISYFISEADQSRNNSSFKICLKEIEKCQLYILLLGKNYGWVPDGYNISVTELEYNAAKKLGRDMLIFKLDYFDRESQQNEFINKVGNFISGSFWGKDIENKTELRTRIISDISRYLIEKSEEANKFFPVKKEQDEFIEIQYNQKSNPIERSASPGSNNGKDLLFLRARINYNHSAGSQYLMRILVNDSILNATNLVNKPLIMKYQDGREYYWFNDQNRSWFISYSPNFKDTYFHKKYKVLNGDPYIFVFDLSNIRKKDKTVYEIIIEHNGLQGNEAYKNSIIVSDIEVF